MFAQRSPRFSAITLNTPHFVRLISRCQYVKYSRLALIVLAVSATSLAFSSAHAAQTPIARILSTDYPARVLAGSTFPITVLAQFSDKVGVDVGIWDVRTGLVLQSASIALKQIGDTNFAFNLTAPTTNGRWELLALARIWWQNAWYQDPVEGSITLTIAVSNTVNIELRSSGTPSMITLDGSRYALSDNPLTVQVAPGIHALEALPIIQKRPGERYVFAGWSDGVRSDTRQIAVGVDLNLTAQYATEYYLSVTSSRGMTAGSGWYPAGSNPQFASTTISNAPASSGVFMESYRFAGWSGDSNSSQATASVFMNGPKNVRANWLRLGAAINLSILSVCFVFLSILLMVRAGYVLSRQRKGGVTSHFPRRLLKTLLPLVLLFVILMSSSQTYGQLPVQSNISTVKIGDASWYYYNNPASDTCLLWIGGGTTDEREIGHYSYEINPFPYESFGTIKFMQDLAKYYCVVALDQGSYAAYSPDANRTIYQELYQMDSPIIGEVHAWIREQGYAHTFLVGYSTGAQVASMEMAVRAPEEWSASDGLILITPFLSAYVIGNAYRLRASLLVLYGSSIETPAYINTGHEFYVNAPKDGESGFNHIFKEFQIINRTGHEVWTIYDTGAYDTQAARTIVSFLNNVKSLQAPQDLMAIVNGTMTIPDTPRDLNITSVYAPTQLSVGSIERIDTQLRYKFPQPSPLQLVVFNPERQAIETMETYNLTGYGTQRISAEIVPSDNSTDLYLQVFLLRMGTKGWQLATTPVLTHTKILQGFVVTIVSTVPNMTLAFDGGGYKTAPNGSINLEGGPGLHIVQVNPVTYVDSSTREVFTGWSSGSTDPKLLVDVENDTSLFANYQVQYLVNVTSDNGQPEGSGWFDANSTVTIWTNQPLQNNSMIFSGWTGDVIGNNSRMVVHVNSPKTMRAEWTPIIKSKPDAILRFMISLVLFSAALIWNLTLTRRRRYNARQES